MNPFAAWLKKKGMSALSAGKAMGWPHPRDAYRYVDGRIPTPERMVEIYEFTDGEVTPNLFVLGKPH